MVIRVTPLVCFKSMLFQNYLLFAIVECNYLVEHYPVTSTSGVFGTATLK